MPESINRKMKHNRRRGGMVRAISLLLRTKKGNVTKENYPDIYFNAIYLERKLYEGVKLVAKYERTSIKRAAAKLLEGALTIYYNEKINQWREEQHAAEAMDQDRRLRANRFILLLRRYAKAQGMDISKFI